jgi:uroporphyrinogen decarboxylase
MTPRERWLNAIKKKGVDRLPCDYWATGEMTEKLMKAVGVKTDDELWKALGIDRMHYVGCAVDDPRGRDRDGADVWGVKYREVIYGNGAGSYAEAAVCPLAGAESVADIENYAWPDSKWWKPERVKERAAAQAGWPIEGGYYSPFYLYTNMRGLEAAMADLAENPDMVDAALERIFRILYDVFERTLQAAPGLIDFMEVTEDLGSQESLLMSPSVFRRLIKPRMRKMIELVHRHGAMAFHHDDGAIRPLLPELLDIGIDVLNPVQWRCPGMDRDGLKRDFGGRVAFHGGIDNQRTLPFGTPDEVRAEVRDSARILGSGGGYILAPCHNIQPITSVGNVLAMYDEVKRL